MNLAFWRTRVHRESVQKANCAPRHPGSQVPKNVISTCAASMHLNHFSVPRTLETRWVPHCLGTKEHCF